MNHSEFHQEACEEEPVGDEAVGDEAPPEFGLVDVVEAFTAMRHEWRGQTRETRTAVESVLAASSTIQELEAKLVACAAEGRQDESRALAELIADTDHQLSRTVAAAVQSEANRRRGEESDGTAIERYFEQMSGPARWFARPLLQFVVELRRSREPAGEDPAVEGLNLVVARLRQSMRDRRIERIDTLGRPFDPNTMNAIGTVDSRDYPSGHVAEQLSPCYFWHDRLLRFADVRVASQRPSEDGLPADAERSQNEDVHSLRS